MAQQHHRAVTGYDLGGAIGHALGVPFGTNYLAFRVALEDAVEVTCRLYPDRESMDRVHALLKTYHVVPNDYDGPLHRRTPEDVVPYTGAVPGAALVAVLARVLGLPAGTIRLEMTIGLDAPVEVTCTLRPERAALDQVCAVLQEFHLVRVEDVAD